MTQGVRTGDTTSSPASHGTCGREPGPLLQTSVRASSGIRTGHTHIAMTTGNTHIAMTTGNTHIAMATGNTHIAMATGNTHIAMATGNTHIAVATGSTHIAMTTHCRLDTVQGHICCSGTFVYT